MPSTAASEGSSPSSSRRLPRSLPYEVEFSLTSRISLTPWPASQRASASRSSAGLDTNAPRNAGIAQNEHRRSQPEAIFSGAATPVPSRRRSTSGTLGPDGGARPSGRSGMSLERDGVAADGPEPRGLADGASGSSLRRSLG